jgi:hypothetical protein
MRLLAVIALLTSIQPAFAMNWEGHEEGWLGDLPPAREFGDAVPQAKPLPSRNCPTGPVARAENPYEQIPLPRHHCPSSKPDKLPGT